MLTAAKVTQVVCWHKYMQYKPLTAQLTDGAWHHCIIVPAVSWFDDAVFYDRLLISIIQCSEACSALGAGAIIALIIVGSQGTPGGETAIVTIAFFGDASQWALETIGSMVVITGRE